MVIMILISNNNDNNEVRKYATENKNNQDRHKKNMCQYSGLNAVIIDAG
jgi:hypothetical protein